MKRDAFAIVAEKNRVLIAGRDDPKEDTHKAIYSKHTGVWAQLHEHATLFGVYEFLERYAGVRMYFPGELGTIVPQTARIVVPEGRIDVAPAFLERNYSAYSDGTWYDGAERDMPLLPARKLNYTRNRMQTLYIPCCHGSNGFRIQERFSKEHPEYMALFKKGDLLVRDLDPAENFCSCALLKRYVFMYFEIVVEGRRQFLDITVTIRFFLVSSSTDPLGIEPVVLEISPYTEIYIILYRDSAIIFCRGRTAVIYNRNFICVFGLEQIRIYDRPICLRMVPFILIVNRCSKI